MSDFRVVSAAEVADEIVKRLACNELPAWAGKAIREMAKHGGYSGQIQIGPGPAPFVICYRLKPDGSMTLQLTDCTQCRIWETTLRPAEDDAA